VTRPATGIYRRKVAQPDAMRAERALALADGKESGRPHGHTPVHDGAARNARAVIHTTLAV